MAGATERSNFLAGLIAFLAYGAGMTLVLLTLSLALALARDSMVRRLRTLLRYTDRIAGTLLVVVGAYLVYYGVYAIDSSNSSSAAVGVVDDWSARASAWLQDGGVTLGAVLAAMVLAGAGWAALRRKTATR